MYSIGLDIGTTSVCGILLNAETGEMIKSYTRPNDTFIQTENEWERIQESSRLIEILKSIADDLLAEGLPVVSIGLTGQMHGLVYLNAEGKPVSVLATWQDDRGNLPYKDGKTYVDVMREVTGYPVATGYGSVTYYYDMVNGRVPEDAVTFCTIMDLAAITLAGKTKPIMHPSDAASFGLFDLKNNCFDKEAIEKLGLDYDMFPEVCSGYTLVGDYNGIPVGVALGDNQASFLGSVADTENTVLVNVGTSSQISCLTHSVPDTDEIDCRPLLDGSYIIAGSALCGGRAYAILERCLRQVAEYITGQKVESAYPAMNRLMEEVTEFSNPLDVDTRFAGTRAQPTVRGSIANIDVDNFNMANLCNGFMYGIIGEMRDMYAQFLPYLAGEKTVMVGSGNAIRNNKALRARVENIFGLSINIPAHKEEAAFGSALYALVAAGIYKTIDDAHKLIRYE